MTNADIAVKSMQGQIQIGSAVAGICGQKAAAALSGINSLSVEETTG
jgi:hypothetical protein